MSCVTRWAESSTGVILNGIACLFIGVSARVSMSLNSLFCGKVTTLRNHSMSREYGYSVAG
ncbi:hypothetical protein ANAPRD1_01164 [Anaplasma phagocytophilum]|nr:hypothetical protein ANAPH1_00721 [Anaplasma phagocytophilum]SCV66607.1 hypothetical protein ANAPRD1_01164 [Anaplasma phagocytophilum]